jgi:hypothetical protein
MWDLSNQFVAVGLTGGLITLLLFLGVLSRSFGDLGKARKRAGGDRKLQWLCWCLGSALLAHVVGWFGCSYMAKMQMSLFPLLAMISVAVFEAKRPEVAHVKTLSNSDLDLVSEPVEAWT